MKHACILLRIKQGRIDDYLKAHQVWPELYEAHRKAGIRNYSLFLYRAESVIIGYFESEDPQASLKQFSEMELCHRWQAKMLEFLEPSKDIAGFPEVCFPEQYFHME